MFATLQYGRNEGDEVHCVEQTTIPPHQGKPSPHLACIACRAKKLGCTGEKLGCQRCLSRDLECVYISEKPAGRKRKHALKGAANSKSTKQPTEAEEPSSGRASRRQSIVVPASASRGSHEQVSYPSNGEGAPHFNTHESILEDVAMMDHLSCSASLSQQTPTALPNFAGDVGRVVDDDDFFSNVTMSFDSNDLLELGDLDHEALHKSHLPDRFGLDHDLTFSIQESLKSAMLARPLSQHAYLTSEGSSSRHSSFPVTPSLTRTGSDDAGARRSPESVSTSDNGCQCTANALRILEKVSTPSKTSGLGSPEQVLYLLKRCIRQCQVLTQCHACCRESGFSILVIMLYEKMISIFERIIAGRQHDSKTLTSTPLRTGSGSSKGEMSLNRSGERDYKRATVLIGEYQIDTLQEHCEIFDTLFLIQLNKLGDLLSESKGNALGANWESHLAVLRSVTQRMKVIKGPFRK